MTNQVESVAYGLLFGLSACSPSESIRMNFTEIQLTHAAQGHTIHNTQVFSRDGLWVVYDTRNDDTQIGSTGSIEMVNTATGEVRVLYETLNQTNAGPGVGAATFSPVADRVLFIHGIRNADASRPYGMTRRTGVAVDVAHPGEPIFMDARDITPPFTRGALRGGTHAHSWSGDGKWISFTYNDYVIEQLAKTDTTIRDLRTVGIMVPGRVDVGEDDTLENNDGAYYSVIITGVTESPKSGSDEIDKAFDECWIGENGYQKPDGSWQHKAIAFQGNVRNEGGETLTEVFVIDLPADPTVARNDQPLEGTATTRPGTLQGVTQRRITHTANGVEGPRHWLRTTPDGSLICFLAEDEQGIIQLFGVSPNAGAIRQVTTNVFPVSGPFNIDPTGRWVAYPADNSLFVTVLETGDTYRITDRFTDEGKPIGAPNWSPNGEAIAYNRYVGEGDARFLQIFLLRGID
ncbi:DUF3748 domain-containing protein [Parapedobacter sp. 10938]|uniref:DUF3748 domain-containing protein n=1 Tax=Parapedobacter flavus TaxID=3110225 RepID=UPI002DBEC6F3|nr:DUF3748 domain-containing protein [Parapedobacter sp. 10938]MEC3881977.1 DUF3748 domain-containing protein [Parapedobacter sp. 10938]